MKRKETWMDEAQQKDFRGICGLIDTIKFAATNLKSWQSGKPESGFPIPTLQPTFTFIPQ